PRRQAQPRRQGELHPDLRDQRQGDGARLPHARRDRRGDQGGRGVAQEERPRKTRKGTEGAPPANGGSRLSRARGAPSKPASRRPANGPLPCLSVFSVVLSTSRGGKPFATPAHSGCAKKAVAVDLNTVILAMLSSWRAEGGDTLGDPTRRTGPAP